MSNFDLFIGKELEVVNSTNSSLIGKKGLIVNETQFTFNIETNDGVKTIVKTTSEFLINGNKVSGREIIQRPHERLKQKWKRK